MSLVRAHDQLVGRSLGEFVLRERIGAGGFGAVYRASQPALDREAVVKVLHPNLHASPAAAERFLREAKLASKLDHPYAAHIYAFGAQPDGELWIAMELVRGTPLDEVLKIQGPLPLERFVPLLDRICEVVHTAHEQGIVHRDIKPGNVMVLARAGRLLPKLLDFGIAKGLASGDGGEADIGGDSTVRFSGQLDIDATADTAGLAATQSTAALVGLTQRGAIMGSPPYMAPEQWVDAGHVDGRTDLYALAVLAYECLTGKPPFSGQTMSQIAQAHARQAPAPLGPRFPAALDKVFVKALAKKAADRYPDALAFAAAFRQAAEIAAEAASLPALDPARRDAAVNGAPQPIAEAVAALAAARNAHQARDAIEQVARTIARYLGLLALACRSRLAAGNDAAGVGDALRALYRRPLTDKEWLALARALTRVWLDRRDAYPVPELVEACHDRAVIEELEALADLREREVHGDEALAELLEQAVARLGKLLDALAFLADYALVVTQPGDVAERWMGARRSQRATMVVRGKGLPAGAPALLDSDGVPVLSLAPLFQVAAPTPGAPPELFLFDGRDARGAKLVALPAGFEHHDDGLWDWFRAELAGSLDENEARVAEEKAPYLGLSAFSAEDGARFFGREQLVDAFANRLKLQPLLAVVGRSGAGKSSFVHAGVVPALAGWRAIALRPGPSPLGALAARLEHAGLGDAGLREQIMDDRASLGALLRADAARRGPIVLVIDQLEEMFTLCTHGFERRAFAEAIAAAARDADDPVRVICTLRDDFLVRTEQIPALRNRIGQGLQLLTVPGPEDLLRILVEPARRAGYELEAGLADEMVKEVADQPGALALISFTAAKLWELRDRHFKQLTRAAYKTLGGVGGALANHADVTLDELPPEERALAREAFRHLVTTQSTRAVLTRKDLRELLGGSEHADRVIERLVAARLLVASENEAGAETIEIVHEALLVNWPRLVEWRREDADGARFREQLRAAAKQWDERSRAKGLLWRGDALADLARWRARHGGPLTELEGAFAAASETDAARGRRNRRALVAGAFTALVAGVVALVVLNTRIDGQRAEAEAERTRYEETAHQLQANLQRQYEDQGRRLVLGGDPQQALAFLAKAGELGAHGREHDFLLAQAAQGLGGELFEVQQDDGFFRARFSHDGTRLVTAGFDRAARVWDAAHGRPLLELPQAGTVYRATFAPDDATVLTATDDSATLWDARDGHARFHVAHVGPVRCAAFAPDGKLVASAGDGDSDVTVWSVAGGARTILHGWGKGPKTCAFSPDGLHLAAGDGEGTTWLWDVHSGRLLYRLAGQHERIFGVAFAPDGTRFVTASWDGTAVEWSVADGHELARMQHRGPVYSAQYSPDGNLVITASFDRTAGVWDARSGERRLSLEGHTAGLRCARFSPDGRYIVTASDDASAWLWDAASGRVVARWHGHEDWIADAAFDPAGRRVVTASDDGKAIVWNVEPQQHATWLRGHQAQIFDARFSADGSRVVTASTDGSARIWDARTGAEVQRIVGTGFTGAAFSPDGARVVTRGVDGGVRIHDVTTGALVRQLTSAAVGMDGTVTWSPDGASIVAVSGDAIRAWDAGSGALRFENHGHGGMSVWSATFDPKGATVITTGDDMTTRTWGLDGKARAAHRDPDGPVSGAYDPSGLHVLSVISRKRAKIWNAATGATEVELVGHLGRVTDARWAPDGKWAVTASADGTARIWDATTGDLLATFPYPGVEIDAVAFSPDGKRLVLAGGNGLAVIHDLPLTPPTAGQLEYLLHCRDPFEVDDDRIVTRVKDAARCSRE